MSASYSLSRHSQSEDDSFIILGSVSPQNSMEAAMVESKISQCSSSKGSDLFTPSTMPGLDKTSLVLENGVSSFNGDFNFDQPSPVSVELANAVMMECSSTLELEAKIVELLEENMILRQTLKQNNLSIKEQFKTIVEWQEDMMKTHQLHKNKFVETKNLIEKLRLENSKLKKDLELVKTDRTSDPCDVKSSVGSNSDLDKSEVMEILTLQLEAIERQRKMVINDNEKLLLEKENLNKEIIGLQEKNFQLTASNQTALELEAVNKQLTQDLATLRQEHDKLIKSKEHESSPDKSFVMTAGNLLSHSNLENTIDILTSQLELVERQRRQVIDDSEKILSEKESLEKVLAETKQKCNDLGLNQKVKSNVDSEDVIRSLEAKVSNLLAELKNSQVKLLQFENMKLEYTQHRLETQDKIKLLNFINAETKQRLKEAHSITFQPVRYSLNLEANTDSLESVNFMENVKVYDSTLKELAGYLNQHSEDFGSLFDCVTDLIKENAGQKQDDSSPIKIMLMSIKEILDKHHYVIANYNHKVKSSLSALENIFLDYKQVLKILKDFETKKNEDSRVSRQKIDELTAHLLAQTQEVTNHEANVKALNEIIQTLQIESDERDLLRAKLDVYKDDFETERDSRTKIASVNEELIENMKILHRRNQNLTEEVKKFHSKLPHNFGNTRKTIPTAGIQPPVPSSSRAQSSVNSLNHMILSCPNCLYRTIDYSLMNTHLNKCLRT